MQNPTCEQQPDLQRVREAGKQVPDRTLAPATKEPVLQAVVLRDPADEARTQPTSGCQGLRKGATTSPLVIREGEQRN